MASTVTGKLNWKDMAVLAGRLVFACIFIMAVTFKSMDITGTVAYIAAAGFPAAMPLAWLAAAFEVLLIPAFASGAYFAEAWLRPM